MFLGRQNAVLRAVTASPAAASTESASASTTYGRTDRTQRDRRPCQAACCRSKCVRFGGCCTSWARGDRARSGADRPYARSGARQGAGNAVPEQARETPVQILAQGRVPGGEAPIAAQRGKRRGAPRQIRRTGERCGLPRQGPGAGRGCIEGSPRQIKRMEVRGGPPLHVKAKGEAAPNGRHAKPGTWMRSV